MTPNWDGKLSRQFQRLREIDFTSERRVTANGEPFSIVA
jgi:hypothetical protein